MSEKDHEAEHFDMSWMGSGWLNGVADLDFKPQLLAEDDETVLKLDGNGAKLRHWKHKSGTPEHVGFTVTDRDSWEENIRPHLLTVDERRIPFDDYAKHRALAGAQNRAFCWAGVAPFEQIHPVCGHENMLMGMALDPDWVMDMMTVFAEFSIIHMEELFARCGDPDFMFFFEDMGFKEKPFMSPAMYHDIVMPAHKRLFDFAHSRNLKVMVHSCGYVEPLVPGMIEAGMDCLQAMEVKAGMDLPQLAKQFGSRIAFCGGIDIRVIASNDHGAIDEELRHRIDPLLKAGVSYALHSDHSIPPQVEYETLKYFLEHGRTINQRFA